MAKDKKSVRKEQPREDQVKDQQNDPGLPGGGKGRRDEVGHSGVYPMSGPRPQGEAEIKPMAEWGQGERGAAGYEDHGESEIFFMPGEKEQAGGEQRQRDSAQTASEQRGQSKKTADASKEPVDEQREATGERADGPRKSA